MANLEKRPAPIKFPHGVKRYDITKHPDARGAFSEIFRDEWITGKPPIQWNMAKSRKGAIRELKVHLKHDDYFVLLEGHVSIGLSDLRSGSPTDGISVIIEMNEENSFGLRIPHGVAHGFYYHKPSIHIVGVSEYYDTADEIQIQWNHPELKINWPEKPTFYSGRVGFAGPIDEIRKKLSPWSPD